MYNLTKKILANVSYKLRILRYTLAIARKKLRIAMTFFYYMVETKRDINTELKKITIKNICEI